MTSDVPLLVRALRGERTERPPCWLMRQAGRYLPVYQRVRSEVSFLELCRRPDLSLEVSMEPIERFGMDGAIVFSDILIPLEAMGMEVVFDDRGPEMTGPVRDAAGIATLAPFDPLEKTPWILETLTGLRESVPGGTAVLGFSGAPFTLAAYAVEGRLTKNMTHVKGLMHRDPALFTDLLTRLADATVPYLAEQARAGAQALQVFDSWAGALARTDWERFCLPSLARIFDGVRRELGEGCPPLILYSNGTSPWLEHLPETKADAFSVDWRLPLDEAQQRLGGRPVQGNLDPTVLFGTPETVRAAVREMLDRVGDAPGVVANLGHGVLVGTPPESVAAFVDEVQGK